MNVWMLAINVIVGSAIGGITNELAIRMLFRPHRPWRIGRWQVPFTPGLIPRRRDEIAVQMGRLVQEHLLTKEGVKRALAQAEMEQNLSLWLEKAARGWMEDSRTLHQWTQTLYPQAIDENGRISEHIRLPQKQAWEKWLQSRLAEYREKPLRQMIPEAGMAKLETALEEVSRLFLEKSRAYLHSPEGLQTLQQMIRGLVGGGGGMFGGLVNMFLGDEKIIGKLLPALDELLTNPALARKIYEVLRVEADKLLDKTVGDVENWIGSEQIQSWSDAAFYKLEEQVLRWADKPLSELLAPLRGTVTTVLIPKVSGWLVETLEKNVEKLFDRLPIREIVTRQVEGFPIERIEEMVVGISGREFRMITVLGFILGGMIGLVQGLLSLLFG